MTDLTFFNISKMKQWIPLRCVKPDRPLLMVFLAVLGLFAVFEIVATIFVLLNAPRERTRTRASVLILVAVSIAFHRIPLELMSQRLRCPVYILSYTIPYRRC